ncbi:mannitol-1-phosphate 5-dehydrogenase [Dolosigranulum pigrum]|jgi:mannitol-1-phosphate 5-dehydrogenase|uniref:Mannitol-1-phosphate 5-dehydrogenase n=1 Tax=Dolosigranulum pigrum TaxID=29394 RepID=A0A1S8KLN3_9LACT|nr:mannitol-1-phosphate 5-dehydrogenase [Dolosigranulum pigrum]OOL80657.1 mannitol-1-phosphate 5-dehydrogenase [Dolosigranulum pigrum]QJS96732.1 mannitol-1-phosphate 5-dehydrogenase [Dolosigranulum pigrum]QTJ32625.1 mannitol-1-phosphate 5-dehydrogenase [Dolosigranulum pigrum]QTJ36110.1 mannitol-1-phosphate 5-dehydrogenase [Dolosigranulum pigrum]
MLAVHFGAGNIGRGFIGEVLYKNGFEISFIDVNDTIIDALNDQGSYTIELAEDGATSIDISNVKGINSKTHLQAVVDEIKQADIITTAIGANILPLIAPTIAEGLSARYGSGNITPLDIIACENMIGGSTLLKEEVLQHIDSEEIKEYINSYIGFPDAAVDRIVPIQSHEDVLKVMVEPYKEWVIDRSGIKNTNIQLDSVSYVDDLAPYIERKLFTVNTGHATTAYHGKYAGYDYIHEALKDDEVYKSVRGALEETGQLMIDKWNFDKKEHQVYIDKILERFKNSKLADKIDRVGRGPIRKAGYSDRFVQPIREATERNLSVDYLTTTLAKLLLFDVSEDSESIKLQERLANEDVKDVVIDITGLTNDKLVNSIAKKYNELNKN